MLEPKRQNFVISLAIIALFSTGSGCKPLSEAEKQTNEKVRGVQEHSLPPIAETTRDESAAVARLRPDARFDGAFVFEIGGQPSCMGIRVAEEYLLTAASCVIDLQTMLPRPAFFPQILNALVWQKGDEKIRTPFVTRALYPHPSLLAYLKSSTAANRFVRSDALDQVSDLVLIRLATEPNTHQPPIVTLSGIDPDSASEAVALHGHCKGSEVDEKLAYDGGRLLTESDWAEKRPRHYFQDNYPQPRALFDCEGFLGAPVFIAGTDPTLIGLSTWMQPRGLTRGVTRLTGQESDTGSIASWITQTTNAPPTYEYPRMNSEVGCTRTVQSAMGDFRVSLQPFKVRLINGFIEHADFQLAVETTVSAPPKELAREQSQPLIPVGSTEVRTLSNQLIRDIRQPSILQYISNEGSSFGDEKVKVSVVSTDKRTLLAVISATNEKTEAERTLNVFFDEFDPDYCLIDAIQNN